jgi:hypothetical protein
LPLAATNRAVGVRKFEDCDFLLGDLESIEMDYKDGGEA